jgi:hypothetical protein
VDAAEPFSHDLTADGELCLRGNGLRCISSSQNTSRLIRSIVTRTASTAATAMRLHITASSACSMVSHPGSIRDPSGASARHFSPAGFTMTAAAAVTAMPLVIDSQGGRKNATNARASPPAPAAK